MLLVASAQSVRGLPPVILLTRFVSSYSYLDRVVVESAGSQICDDTTYVTSCVFRNVGGAALSSTAFFEVVNTTITDSSWCLNAYGDVRVADSLLDNCYNG